MPTLLARRMAQQGLLSRPFATPEDAVRHLGAVQAQEYDPALEAVALRMSGGAAAAVDEALARGSLVRTHVLRPTWHLVAAEDLRPWLRLTAPRIRRALAHGDRLTGVDAPLVARSASVLAEAVRGGWYRTRRELAEILAGHGIRLSVQGLAHLVMHAELDEVLVSGPRRGRHATYALMDERIPNATTVDRDETLRSLARRYVNGHGPARTQDFAWWAGLTRTDALAGLVASGLPTQARDGATFFLPETPVRSPHDAPRAVLLHTYDEAVVAFDGFGKALNVDGAQTPPRFFSGVVLDGRVVGWWRRTARANRWDVTVALARPLTSDECAAVVTAAEVLGHAASATVECRFVPPASASV
ncbi:MAG: AlkZ family DNA glycosylase [Rhodothermales bacterium]|nr:AlkZ family DNA glycosylase [Rhodothermales bacterium]